MHRRFLVPLLTSLWLAAGCATPEARIRQNPDKFATLPDDVRAKVQEGKVEVGFPEDAVYLALGNPDRVYSRSTMNDNAKVWSYVSREYFSDRQLVRGSHRVRDADGRVRSVSDDVWVDVQNWREYERMRIEMKDGVVVAVETLQR